MWKTISHAVLVLALLALAPAGAETLMAPETDPPDLRATLPAEPEPRDAAETIDPAILETLDVDAPSLARPSGAWQLPPPVDPNTSEWKRAERPNGRDQITVKKPLPLAWDAKIGADLSPATSTVYDRSERPLPMLNDRGTGTAWLNVAVPNIAAVELRANSDQDRNKLGAAFIRSLPLGEKYAVTFENRYAVVEPLSTTFVPAGLAPPAKAWNTDRLVKFGILNSGTTLAVGTTSSTADNVTHSKLSAEQNIYGPLNVTTALTDVGAPTAAKSISAGFKLNW